MSILEGLALIFSILVFFFMGWANAATRKWRFKYGDLLYLDGSGKLKKVKGRDKNKLPVGVALESGEVMTHGTVSCEIEGNEYEKIVLDLIDEWNREHLISNEYLNRLKMTIYKMRNPNGLRKGEKQCTQTKQI